jgi:hypothetical protein
LASFSIHNILIEGRPINGKHEHQAGSEKKSSSVAIAGGGTENQPGNNVPAFVKKDEQSRPGTILDRNQVRQ